MVMKKSKLVCIQDDMANLKRNRRQSILLIIALEKEPTPNRYFTNLQVLDFFNIQRYTHGL